ncbi:MAG TPA: fluoride efflux transporter CrcB [Bacillus bacterium]|nr:fluoride efflux transporter CrcB [Bacillus sp. (in: firmicutes)]
MIAVLLVAVGGMAGALARFVIQKLIDTKNVPLPTIIANLLGSFLLGLIVGNGIHGHLYLLSATGFMGAFTTFSTLNVDLIRLISNKKSKEAIIYCLATYAGGLFCAFAGLVAGKWI